MKHNFKKRIISFVLCVSMVVPMFSYIVPVFAVGQSEYESNIGCTATFNKTNGDESYLITEDEPSQNYIDELMVFWADDFPSDLVLEIVSYKVVTEKYEDFDDDGQIITKTRESLWYQVKSLTGTLPSDFFDGYWVMQNYLNAEDVYSYDSLIIYPKETDAIYDANGNEITSITMSQYEKPEFIAKNTLSGTVNYQWQIEYAPNQWVNINGEDSATIKLSYGMVSPLLDENDMVNIRVRSYSSTGESYSRVIPVKLTPDTANDEVVVSSFEQVNTYSVRSDSLSSSAYDVNAVDEGDGSTESTTIYNVLIQYVFADGRQAANPWTATIEAGGSYKGTINSPAVVGYAPDKTSIELDIQNISENLTYTVTYAPAEVKFTVVHEFQNIDNEEYSEFRRITHMGYTDSAVGSGLALTADEMAAEGVYALPYDIEQKIAADGSTEVIIQYDRYYYLMTFELSGGYGVEPIYARVGTPITVGTPIRAGYAFAGWLPAVPNVMPAQDTTITAQWTPSDTTYTVVYWAENANDNGYSFWAYKELGAVSGTTVSGSDDFNGTDALPKTGFHFDHADTNVVVKGDGSTVVNVYYKRNTYTLTFAYEGGPLICDVHVHSSSCYNLSCGQTEHEHSDSCCGYGETGNRHRRHDDNCCSLELTEHTHRTSCYSGSPICGKTGVSNHTHRVSDGCYGMKFEGIKYGQDTSYWWNQAPAYRWKTTSSGNTAYTYAPAMPNSNLIVYGQTLTSSYQYTIHYYEEGTTNKVHEDNVYYRDSDGYSLTDEDYITIPGFRCLNSGSTQHSNGVYIIYYHRESYSLTFKNGNETKDAGTFPYQADISGQYYVPTYNGDDPEGYTFGGWYTTEACVAGTEWNPTGATMPYNNLILYAKWVPVSHEVKLYVTKADWENGKQYLDTMTVPHNTTAQEPARPSNGSYNFVGWFYMDDGKEKAFDFDIPVREDLNLYGKWVADELATYTIRYAIENADGSLTYIADDTMGNALAGQDKTFEAKFGTELYPDYQTGYYPETNSHSIPILLDSENTYTFIYVPKEKVAYIVKYLEKGTETVLHSQKEDTTREAIHTENFVYISGYRPDAYQKRIILSSNEEENVIIFWYETDTTHAPVLVKHYLQNAAGTGYNTENPYLTTTDLDGVINEPYSVDIITTLEGYRFAKAEASHEVNGEKRTVQITVGDTQVSAVVTNEGLLIELYYDRISYPYEFKFLEQGTDKVLADSVTGSAIYGSQVTQKAITIPGYICQTENQDMIIQIEDGVAAVRNVRIFYYVEQTVEIQYTPVGPGTTNPSSQTNIPVFSGTVGGSIATPDAGSTFVGWYKDEACTIPVDASWVSDSKITPVKTKSYGETTGYEAATYYAKFVENEVIINYKVVGPTGCGTVSPESESVKVSTGVAGGSVATASNSAYEFVGWYADEDCTQLLTNDAKYVPSKSEQTKLYEAKTYYAKFVENQVEIKYIAINQYYNEMSDTTIGYVTLNSGGAAATSVVETLGEYSGSAVGASAAVTNSDYLFTGWYYKSEDGRYRPVSDEVSYTPPKSGDYNQAATYYARFIPTPTVTIEKVVTSNGEAVPRAELAGYKAEFKLVNSQGTTVATATVEYDANGNAEPANFTFVDSFDFTTYAKLELIETSCDYVYDQECVSTTFTGKDETAVLVEDNHTYIELMVDGRTLNVVCTNDYPVKSYISVEKALSFGDSIEESHKTEIIEAYYNDGTPTTVRFALTTKEAPDTVLATAKAYADAEGNFEAVKFIDVETNRTFIPKIGETYVITETSDYAIIGYFWTHSAVEITVGEAIEGISYTNHYERPSVTITKNVISKDTAGNAVKDDELNRLIRKYADGKYQATFVLTDYATSNVAGKLVITFSDGYDSASTTNRTGTVYLNDDYLKTLTANSDIKLVINEDHTNGATTILGSEYPGVSFNGAVEESDNKYVITLSAEHPNAEIVCVNEYPPASYISVQKKLDLTNVATDKQDEVYAYYESNPYVQFALYKNYGAEGAVVVANATSVYNPETNTFSKATFVAGEYGNAFEPEVSVAYTIVETSTHRLGGYVWQKIGTSGSETISVSVSADNPVSENTYTNKYTTAEVGLEIEKTLVFNDESGNPLSIEDIKKVLDGIEGDTKSYTATFGIWETTSDYQKKNKIAEAIVTIGRTDFGTGNTATKVAEITPLGEVTDLNAYLKEKGQSETETYLLIVEESATEIASNKLDVDYGIVNGKFNESHDQYIVLGGAGTKNQVYSHEVVCRNTYPPTNLRTSLRIVKEEAVKGTIKDGEQFSFIVYTQIGGEDVEREVVIVWDSSKDENSVTITDIPLKTTVVVETGWGWRYEPDQGRKQMLLSVGVSDNIITFTNKLDNDKWLDDQVIAENNFAAVSTAEATN